MDQEILFRMNFLLQDSSATTTKTYLAKIIESILYENSQPLNIHEISDFIKSMFFLEFTDDEIIEAIAKKAKHIVTQNDKYTLTPEYANILSHTQSVDLLLTGFIKDAIVELNLNIAQTDLHDLLTRYLYFCFNSNKNILLALIEGSPLEENVTFTASNDEITIINKFISWKNERKNEFIYKVISYCYVYCSLNVRKDSLFSKGLFKNKQFCLDANIIFRLAGINNDDRRQTITSFINKCNEVGIKLSYTNFTLDELYRVITSKVTWIKGITHSSEPINISDIEAYGNDFYNLYIEWCKKPQNQYNDFLSFQKFLINRIDEVITKLECINLTDFSIKNKANFDTYSKSLKIHKENNLRKPQSAISVNTDINNVLYIMEERSKKAGGNIFSTNNFLISADQNLISWTQQLSSGIPIVVLPSIWLTIILRFSGRSEDDYRAFCSFMSLRTHSGSNDIDVFTLIKELGFHTDNKSLKEKIVAEILAHKNEYIPVNNDYTETINKAFDTIRKQDADHEQFKFNEIIQSKELQLQTEKNEALSLSQEQERIKNINALVNKELKKKIYLPALFNSYKKPTAFVLGTLIVLTFALWCFNITPVYTFYEWIIPDKFDTIEAKFGFIAAIWGGIVLLAGSCSCFLSHLVSETRISKLKSKLEKKYTKILSI